MELEASAAKMFCNRKFKALLFLVSLLIVFFFLIRGNLDCSHWKEDMFLSLLVI